MWLGVRVFDGLCLHTELSVFRTLGKIGVYGFGRFEGWGGLCCLALCVGEH